MRTTLVCLLLLCIAQVQAQRECATQAYIQSIKSSDLAAAQKISETETSTAIQGAFRTTSEIPQIILIPVVVHVLYNTESQNISNEQIKSQIDALNRDFRRTNWDTINTPERFKPFAADVQIEFVLAKSDPNGRATTGVIRKKTSVSYWGMDDKIKFNAQGGDHAWDSRYYLNIWVGNTRSLLGYSSAPGGPADKDGIVINTTAFGTINVNAPYHLGRTAVHEIGHWLGLKHIWGDDYCGNDMVDDTPKQAGFTSGCPTGFRTTCSNAPLGDMYMNYMDFTNDACINLFTEGQKQRMRSLFNEGGVKNSILSSKGLSEPWVEEMPVTEVPTVIPKSSLYPNPAINEAYLNFEGNETWIGKEIRILNIQGVVLQKLTIDSRLQKITLTQLKPGMYFIQGENGVQRLKEKIIKL